MMPEKRAFDSHNGRTILEYLTQHNHLFVAYVGPKIFPENLDFIC